MTQENDRGLVLAWPAPLACDFDCDDGCSMTEFPVWMRPYRCRHVTATIRRARDEAEARRAVAKLMSEP